MEHFLQEQKNPCFVETPRITTEVQKSPPGIRLVVRHKTTTHTLEGAEKSYAKTITLANTLKYIISLTVNLVINSLCFVFFMNVLQKFTV